MLRPSGCWTNKRQKKKKTTRLELARTACCRLIVVGMGVGGRFKVRGSSPVAPARPAAGSHCTHAPPCGSSIGMGHTMSCAARGCGPTCIRELSARAPSCRGQWRRNRATGAAGANFSLHAPFLDDPRSQCIAVLSKLESRVAAEVQGIGSMWATVQVQGLLLRPMAEFDHQLRLRGQRKGQKAGHCGK